MAGHSHWAGIKHKKGVADAKRGKIFSKHAKAIIVAARLGGGDPDMNLRLKYAIDKAKADNMPKDNIERAVKKGTGELEGEAFEAVLYEGYLAGGVAVMIDALTDNRNRTAPDLRRLLEKRGGNLGVAGAVSFMFEQVSLFTIPGDAYGEDQLLEVAAEIGADDVRGGTGGFELIGPWKSFAELREGLAAHGIEFEQAEITYLPRSTVDVTDLEVGRQVLAALEDLDNNEDVQNTYCNFEMSDELLAALEE